MPYIGVSVHGGLFTPDLLDGVGKGTATGQRAEDFGLEPNRRVMDEIAAIWGEAQLHWRALASRLGRMSDAERRATTETRVLWLETLLNLLGYRPQLIPQAAVLGDKRYPISHRIESTTSGTPMHLVGCRVPLDRMDDTLGRRLSPHALVQEYLNRSEPADRPRWGVLSNGYLFRLMRSNPGISRPTYVEFDLQTILDQERFPEFALFYRLCHRSRHTAELGGPCLLEDYRKYGIETGSRVRDKMRDGVQRALEEFGNGFLMHPNNEPLRERVRSGALGSADYYRQLLMLVYRLLFLLVAESREMVFPRDMPDLERRKAIYDRFYSVNRLRHLCERAEGQDGHSDLWQGLCTAFQSLFAYDRDGENPLGVPVINGHLFGSEITPDLDGSQLVNDALLRAIRDLTLFWHEDARRRRILLRVDFRALDVEEFGSVYESLLELRPDIQRAGDGNLTFAFVEGSERRSTGSYYTPHDLVQQLVDHTLVPVVAERVEADGNDAVAKESALLNLSVLDPACGSGHFLLAAARYLGRKLAEIRTGEVEPDPAAFQSAVRDVIQHCLYGVDKNPLAVDLCKLALWIEGHNVGKPVSFLDHRIKCGDSLVGIHRLEQLAEGIPDVAFTPIGQDDRKVSALVKKDQKRWHQGGRFIWEAQPSDEMKVLAGAFSRVATLPEDTAGQEREKEVLYQELRAEHKWRRAVAAADAWTAAAFWPLVADEAEHVPTDATVAGLLRGEGVDIERIERMAQEQRFFHWPLEYPSVMALGGFDVVLGNPPFLGGLKIAPSFGECYRRRWLHSAFSGTGGKADLCAYFFRRAFVLTKAKGFLAFVATNTISQGDTREAGLDAIVASGASIVFAVSSMSWPGDAALEVSLVAVRKGGWSGRHLLNGAEVGTITALLDDGSAGIGLPEQLSENRSVQFQGCVLHGIGFALSDDEALRWSRGECVFRYLAGKDVNSRPDQSASRYVINFGRLPMKTVSALWPDLLRIVERRVLPERESLKGRLKQAWWQYEHTADGLYSAVGNLARCLVTCIVTAHLGFTFVEEPSTIVFDHSLVVFALHDYASFSVLQSSFHELWTRKRCSTQETRLRYVPTDCFETFAFPQVLPTEQPAQLCDVGKKYYGYRVALMRRRNLGLTSVYNLFHDPRCSDPDINELRSLRRELDVAVSVSYGWKDLDLKHGFHEHYVMRIPRFTVAPEVQVEVLRRLLGLNHERAVLMGRA